jgi:hypothetical protein
MSIAAVVFESAISDFYRTTVWDTPPPETPHEKLLPCTRAQYAAVPFLARLYRTEGLLTKVAYEGEKPFLIGRHLEDIASESYGALGDRPLVAFSSTHEGLEKSLWCYTRNILPLITNDDPDITGMLAKRYEVDTLITDTATLSILLPALARHYALARFRRVSIIDHTFNLPLLKKMFPEAALSLILGLPETGSIASACPEALARGELSFHAAPHRTLERDNTLTFTDDRLLPTPLIRYQPGIAIRFLSPSCGCGANETFALTDTV